jgi:hypothetical protein
VRKRDPDGHCLSSLMPLRRKSLQEGFSPLTMWFESVRRANEFCKQNPQFIKEVELKKIDIYRKKTV